MSRRRRVFLLVAGGIALVVVAAVVLVTRLGGGPGPRPSQAERGPVVLVPGYGGSLAALQPIRDRLQAAGRRVQQLDLPDSGVGDLRTQAAQLARLVDDDLASGAPSVDLVGYSAGGVVVRIYVDDDGGAAHTRRVVTIGAPQHGTTVAAAAGLVLAGGCTGGCAQLQPDSDLLAALNAGPEIAAGVPWVTTWSDVDQTVVPPDSEQLDGAQNIVLQSVCPADRTSHSLEPRDPLVVGITALTLDAPTVPPALAARGCTALQQAGTVSS